MSGVLGGLLRLFTPAAARSRADAQPLMLDSGANFMVPAGRLVSDGGAVTMHRALQLSAVWACIKLTAQAVSSLPLGFYERRDENDRTRVDNDLAQLFADGPNADQTALEFWEGQVAWLLTRGNAYAEKRSIGKRLTSLEPIPASQVTPVRLADGTLVYRIGDRGKTFDLPRDQMFHIKGFGQAFPNRDLGLSPIAAGGSSHWSALAAQESAAAVHENGMRPAGFFLFDKILSAEQRVQARKVLVDPLMGPDRSGSIGILEAGVKWEGITLTPEDAQLLETRRFDIEEICRWYGVPPIVIGHSAQGQTMWGSGVEQILISWLTLGIDPICDRIEARIRKDLIRSNGGRRVYAEFNREALLQMDSTAKANFLSVMVQNGMMTRSEGRAKLNLKDIEGADFLTAQTNLAPLDRLRAGNDAPTKGIR